MLILGIETSCDETGAAIYTAPRASSPRLHSQVALHDPYGGWSPSSHRAIMSGAPSLVRAVLHRSGARESDLDAVAYTRSRLAGALLWARPSRTALLWPSHSAIGCTTSRASTLAAFGEGLSHFRRRPARLRSHTQLMRVGDWRLRDARETLDDAARGFRQDRKVARPGIPAARSRSSPSAQARSLRVPGRCSSSCSGARPDFSFSGLKTAS